MYFVIENLFFPFDCVNEKTSKISVAIDFVAGICVWKATMILMQKKFSMSRSCLPALPLTWSRILLINLNSFLVLNVFLFVFLTSSYLSIVLVLGTVETNRKATDWKTDQPYICNLSKLIDQFSKNVATDQNCVGWQLAGSWWQLDINYGSGVSRQLGVTWTPGNERMNFEEMTIR